MTIKMIKKSVTKLKFEPIVQPEEKVKEFISKGGTLANINEENIVEKNDDHRLTLRIPKWLLNKIDAKRKERVGTISRNLWILEAIEKI